MGPKLCGTGKTTDLPGDLRGGCYPSLQKKRDMRKVKTGLQGISLSHELIHNYYGWGLEEKGGRGRHKKKKNVDLGHDCKKLKKMFKESGIIEGGGGGLTDRALSEKKINGGKEKNYYRGIETGGGQAPKAGGGDQGGNLKLA